MLPSKFNSKTQFQSQKVYRITDERIKQFIDDISPFNTIPHKSVLKGKRNDCENVVFEYVVDAVELDKHLPKNDKATALIFDCLYPIKDNSVKQTLQAIFSLNLVDGNIKYNVKPFVECLMVWLFQNNSITLSEKEHSEFMSMYKAIVEQIEEYAQQHTYEIDNWYEIECVNFKAAVKNIEIPYKDCQAPSWWDCYQDQADWANKLYQLDCEKTDRNLYLRNYMHILWDFWIALVDYDTTYKFLTSIVTIANIKENQFARRMLCEYIKNASEEWENENKGGN